MTDIKAFSEEKMSLTFGFVNTEVSKTGRRERHLVIESNWLEFFEQLKAAPICGF